MKDSTFFLLISELDWNMERSVASQCTSRMTKRTTICIFVVTSMILLSGRPPTRKVRANAQLVKRAVINDRDDFASCHRTEFKIGNARLCQSE